MDKIKYENLDNVLKNFKINVLKKYPDAKIILFGSRARGDNLKNSDYDLIVLSDLFKGKKIPERFDVYECFEGKNNVDILPYTFEEFDEYSNRLTIAGKAKKEGKFI
jgi:hypothetical protein